jgi:alkylation response protein AidB-like acyl-CoA dehydrogenase
MAPSRSAAVFDGDVSAHEPVAKKVKPNPTPDPIVYDIYHQKFISDGLPSTAEAWIEWARQVAIIFAQDATGRDIENKSPKAEIQLLKSAGLLKLLGPKAIGGGGKRGMSDTKSSGKSQRVTAVWACY